MASSFDRLLTLFDWLFSLFIGLFQILHFSAQFPSPLMPQKSDNNEVCDKWNKLDFNSWSLIKNGSPADSNKPTVLSNLWGSSLAPQKKSVEFLPPPLNWKKQGWKGEIIMPMIFLQTLWFTYEGMIFFCYDLADSAMCTLSCWIQLWKYHPTSSAMCIWILFPSGQCFLYRMWSWSSLYWPRPGTETLSLWNLQSQSKKNFERHYIEFQGCRSETPTLGIKYVDWSH